MRCREQQYFLFLILVSLAVVGYFSLLWRHYQLDDALIYLRYIRNFHEGNGLVYNLGEKFNGLTSPLYTFIMMGVSYLITNLQTATIVISGLFLLMTAIIAAQIFSKNKWEAIFTALFISSFQYFYTTLGMETSLFLMLISLSIYLYKIESDLFLIALAFLVITRSEGIFLATPMTLDYLIRNKRLPKVTCILISLIIFLSPLVFNYFYYGDFLPVTGAIKIGQGKSQFWGQGWLFFNLPLQVSAALANNKIVECGFLLCLFYGLFALIKERTALLLILFGILLLMFYGGLNIPNYHWYYAPFFLIAILFYCSGVGLLSSIFLSKGWFHRRAYLGLPLLMGMLFLPISIVSFAVPGNIESYVTLGNWIKKNTPENASIGMVEIGTVGWYSERKIIDILGLVNKYNGTYIAKNDVFSWLSHYQPDYILIHDPAWPLEAASMMLQQKAAYQPVAMVNFPGYQLLEKTNKYTDRQIADLAINHQYSQKLLTQMLLSSAIGAPMVLLDSSGLFAHAPSVLHFILPQKTKQIAISYGIKTGASGKHEGVCFEIIREKNNQSLFKQCIDTAEDSLPLLKRNSFDVNGLKGEKLLFKTSCKYSCNYAWSFWHELLIVTG